MAAHGEIDREKVLDYFEEQLLLKMRSAKKPNEILITSIVMYMMDLYPDENYEIIKKAFEFDLVDSEMTNLKEVDDILTLDKQFYLKQQLNYTKPLIIDNTIAELKNWGFFQDQHPITSNLTIDNNTQLTNPAIRQEKIDRNDPCPCGSGRKYKKCCRK